MEDEISFLKEMLNKWDKSIELMNGTDAEIYRCIQDRLKNLTKHNNDFKKPCPNCNGRGYTEGGEKLLGEYNKIYCEDCKGQGFIKS